MEEHMVVQKSTGNHPKMSSIQVGKQGSIHLNRGLGHPQLWSIYRCKVLAVIHIAYSHGKYWQQSMRHRCNFWNVHVQSYILLHSATMCDRYLADSTCVESRKYFVNLLLLACLVHLSYHAYSQRVCFAFLLSVQKCWDLTCPGGGWNAKIL